MVLISGIFYKHLTNDVDVVVGRPPCQGITQNWIMMLSQLTAEADMPVDKHNVSAPSNTANVFFIHILLFNYFDIMVKRTINYLYCTTLK